MDLLFDGIEYCVHGKSSTNKKHRGVSLKEPQTHTNNGVHDIEAGLPSDVPNNRSPAPPIKSQPWILSQISGVVPAGKLLVIMGPSGAGKSSLMDVLAGRDKMGTWQGTIQLRDAHSNTLQSIQTERDRELYRTLSAYVTQDDAFLDNLTVWETLSYAIDLKVPSSRYWTGAKKEGKIQTVLRALALTHVSHSRVGMPLKRGISGGERRRLSIAVEMVTEPKIVFLDEPTSGLDSRNALRVMKAVKRLCEHHKTTVICTIHQPSSTVFHLFDYLMVLEHGRCAYFGEAMKSLDYFEPLRVKCPSYMNPAEYLLDMVLEDGEEAEADFFHVGGGQGHGVGGNKEEQHVHFGTNAEEKQAVDLPGTAIPSTAPPPKKTAMTKRGTSQSSTVGVNIPAKPPPIHLGDAFTKSDACQALRHQIKSLQSGAKQDVLLSEHWKTLQQPQRDSHQQRSLSRDTWILVKRTWINTTRDSSIMYIRSLSAWGIAALVGAIYFQISTAPSSGRNRTQSLLFLMCVFSLFCLPNISKTIEDRLIFQRERASGAYSTLPYFLAGWLVELPILLLMVVGYAFILNFMVGYHYAPPEFLFFVATVFLVVNVGFSLSVALASLVRTTNMAIALFMILLVYSLLFGGFMMSAKDLPDGMQWTLKTSYFNYGFEALMVNEFRDRADTRGTGLVWGNAFLETMGMQDANKNWDLVGLVAWFLGFRLIAYLGLRYCNREKR